jgi:hypothetical protein
MITNSIPATISQSIGVEAYSNLTIEFATENDVNVTNLLNKRKAIVNEKH